MERRRLHRLIDVDADEDVSVPGNLRRLNMLQSFVSKKHFLVAGYFLACA